MTSRLTQKQERFCTEYFKTGHATNSAIAAGYSPHTAHPIAVENLQKPAIQQRMAELNAPAVTEAQLTRQHKRDRLANIYNQEPQKGTVSARAIVSAITEDNRMAGEYVLAERSNETIISFMFKLPDGTKLAPSQLLNRGADIVDGEATEVE